MSSPANGNLLRSAMLDALNRPGKGSIVRLKPQHSYYKLHGDNTWTVQAFVSHAGIFNLEDAHGTHCLAYALDFDVVSFIAHSAH